MSQQPNAPRVARAGMAAVAALAISCSGTYGGPPVPQWNDFGFDPNAPLDAGRDGPIESSDGKSDAPADGQVDASDASDG